jgi:hypothetical protein
VTRAVRHVAALAAAALAAVTFAAAPQAGAAKSAAPTYRTYHEPGENEGDGEPSFGVDWKTGTGMYQSGLRTLAITFDAKGNAHWEERSAITTSQETLDPILYTDGSAGRTYVSQLAADCSLLAYTDDDGKNWTPSTGCGPGVYIDHQTVGAGPYPLNITHVSIATDHAVYYCAQALVNASCARSDNGGISFGPAVPMYPAGQCAGLHGHVRVAPDGTVYVPQMDCGGAQGFAVSEDGGLTWALRTVDGSKVNEESDPSVAAGADNTTYFGYQDGAGNANTRAMVAVTRDHGRTFGTPVDVSSRLGIKNVQFPEMIAGDGDRAALAFLGTKTAGNDQDNGFEGPWHLYIATTYDRGRTWTTVDATPKELVQRGCVQLTGCNHRNLLDFNDIAIDKQGRVYVGWADGCPLNCEKGAPWSSHWHSAVITRQSSGRGLFKAYDGKI